VTWQRILALHTGVATYSVAVIVASFMAGLGLGSHLGARATLRWDMRRCLLAFALVELAIAAFGLLSPVLYYDWLYLRAVWLYRPLWRGAAVHLASLAIPTTLMGMSLPLLARGTVESPASAARRLGALYGLNALGAALGAFVTPWVLIRQLGMPGAVEVAAAANVAAGLAALLVWLRHPERAAAPAGERGISAEILRDKPTTDVPQDDGTRRPFAVWMALYAASGFCALGLEILWFRIVDVGVKSTPFTFGSILALYLAGLGAGSLAGAWWAPRVRDPLRAFLTVQCAILGLAGAAVVLLARLPPDTPGFAWFWDYWGQTAGFELGAAWSLPALLRLYLVLPLFLFGLPTLLMGLSFPLLQRAVQDDVARSGYRVGTLQAANIAGCVAGSLAVGLVALAWLGSTGSLRALLGVGMTFALLGLAWFGWRSRFAVAAVLLAAVALALPSGEAFWARLHGRPPADVLAGEDATGVGAIARAPEDRWAVFVNGRAHSWIPFGGVHTRLGAIPAIVHPEPRDVAIIGLGSGDTVWGAGCRPATARIDVFELSGPQPGLLRRLSQPPDRPSLDPLRRLLADPRLRLVIDDGRSSLQQSPRAYDVIEADPLRPDMALSGNLYSRQYFQLCARRLKPGGLMCTWVPTVRVGRTFRQVFPYVLMIERDQVAIGSNQPLPVDVAAWRARLESPEVVAYLGAATARLVLQSLETARAAGPVRGEGVLPNEDLYPRDEFLTP
jgi:spermidine synthase